MVILKQTTPATDSYAITLGFGFFAITSIFSYAMKFLIRPLFLAICKSSDYELQKNSMDLYDCIMFASVYLLTIISLTHAHYLLPLLVTTPIGFYPLCVGGLMCMLIKYMYNEVIVNLYHELKNHEYNLKGAKNILEDSFPNSNLYNAKTITSTELSYRQKEIDQVIEHHSKRPIDSSEVSVRQLAYALWLFDMDSAIDRSREGALALLTEEKKEIQALIESKNQPA